MAQGRRSRHDHTTCNARTGRRLCHAYRGAQWKAGSQASVVLEGHTSDSDSGGGFSGYYGVGSAHSQDIADDGFSDNGDRERLKRRQDVFEHTEPQVIPGVYQAKGQHASVSLEQQALSSVSATIEDLVGGTATGSESIWSDRLEIQWHQPAKVAHQRCYGGESIVR